MVEQSNDAQASVDTKKCPMCQKDIESAKFRLHEVACARMNYKCAKCGEIVPKADREQHEEDVHTDKPVVPESSVQSQPPVKVDSALAGFQQESFPTRPQAAQAKPQVAQVQPVMPAQAQPASSAFNQALSASVAEVGAYQAMEAGGAGGAHAMGAGGAVGDDGMDENERMIARILQEEANAIDAQNIANMPAQHEQQPFLPNADAQAQDDSGVRAPDQSRVQALFGPDADYDAEADRRFLREQQRLDRNRGGIMDDMGSSMASAASAFGRFIGIGGGADQPQPGDQQQLPQRQPAGDNYGMSEEEKQMQLAMEASMMAGPGAQSNQVEQQQQPVEQLGSQGTGLSNEEEMMARAIAESMSIDQIQQRNDHYQQQMAQGYEDEDAMLARVLAESQQNM